FGENPKRVYNEKNKMPMTRMAIAGLLRELLFKSKEYLLKKETNQPVEFNFKYEAMIPVLKKEIPLKAHAHRADDMYTALRIAQEFDLNITLDHCTEGHLMAEDIKKANVNAFVGPSMTSRSKFELKNRTFKTPQILVAAGVDVAIVTDAPVIPLEYLPVCVGLAIKSGLSFEEGLKSITINPARFMGVDHLIGSIEPGKEADLVITNGDPFNIETSVIYTLINGAIVFNNTSSI
ncbi:MAG: amidohydrolase family protein, partial [Bacilli bacterium]